MNKDNLRQYLFESGEMELAKDDSHIHGFSIAGSWPCTKSHVVLIASFKDFKGSALIELSTKQTEDELVQIFAKGFDLAVDDLIDNILKIQNLFYEIDQKIEINQIVLTQAMKNAI